MVGDGRGSFHRQGGVAELMPTLRLQAHGFEGLGCRPVLLDAADLPVAGPHCPALVDIKFDAALHPTETKAQDDYQGVAAPYDVPHRGLDAVAPDLAETGKSPPEPSVTMKGFSRPEVSPRGEQHSGRVKVPRRASRLVEDVGSTPRELHVLLRNKRSSPSRAESRPFHSSRVTPTASWDLLRHRLVLEAEVGEGVLALPVSDQPRHPAVADVEKFRALLVDLDRTRLAASAKLHEREDALIVEVAQLGRLNAVVVPRSQLVVEGICHRGDSAPCAGL